LAALIEGYDCPFGSTLWNVTFHEGIHTVTNQDAICIFEQDMGFPLSRHRYGSGAGDYPFSQLGVVKGAALVVRTIATVGNYDYMFRYVVAAILDQMFPFLTFVAICSTRTHQ